MPATHNRFIDVVGFTSMSNEVSSQSVIAFLSQFFTVLDQLLEDFNVYKVDTYGDCYIVAGGLMERSEGDGELVLAGDVDPKEGAQQVMEYIAVRMRGGGGKDLVLAGHLVSNGGQRKSRIYVTHTMASLPASVLECTQALVLLVSSKLPKFSLRGDTMNTASRMKWTSQPGLIQLSETTFDLLDPKLKSGFTTMEGVEVKGKGMMRTHVLSMEDLIKGQKASILPSSKPERKSNIRRLSPMPSLRRSQSLLRQACRLALETTTGASNRRQVCKEYKDSKAKARKKELLDGPACEHVQGLLVYVLNMIYSDWSKSTTEASQSRLLFKEYKDSKAKATKKRLLAQLVKMYKASSSTSST
eukprot:gene31491-6677_t